MKQFLKRVCASALGTFLAFGFISFFVFFILMTLVFTSAVNQSQWKPDSIKESSVLKLDLKGSLKDRVGSTFFSFLFSDDPSGEMGLYEISRVLKQAAQDKRIKGLLLEFKGFSGGWAGTEALRREILNFKKSGKFVMAYANEGYSERDYILASVADEIILYPKGYFFWNGLSAERTYFRKTLEKLHIFPQSFRVGEYKSAIETFTMDKMSRESRKQINELLTTYWNQILLYAGEKTKLSSGDLNQLAETMSVIYADQAKEKGFVDQLASRKEVEDKILELTGTKDKPNYVGWRSFYRSMDRGMELADKKNSKKVALVFVEGEIYDGDRYSHSHRDEGIFSGSFSKLMDKIRRDKDVKAVVLRVNSPGGSALASDVIWTSTRHLKEEKKFLVTSFGNVAASGGYYISSASDYIFSEPTTITGSIGVFGLFPATEEFFNSKLGVTFDTVKTHFFSDISSLKRPFKSSERILIQDHIDKIYQNFLSAVVQGRHTFKDKKGS